MDEFTGEIRIFALNFAIKNWALCNGQTMSIAQNSALFSLLGTEYGGDGKTTFMLPNLQGRAAMHAGQGPGLTGRRIGEAGGTTNVTLMTSQMAAHSHIVQAVAANAETGSPTGGMLAAGNAPGSRGATVPKAFYYPDVTAPVMMNQAALQTAGGSMPHNNMQPYLGLNFQVCLYGIYPSRP